MEKKEVAKKMKVRHEGKTIHHIHKGKKVEHKSVQKASFPKTEQEDQKSMGGNLKNSY